jgi:hypothetical protein
MRLGETRLEPTDEVVALWREVFGEPPAITADVDLMARVLIEHLEAAPPYRPKGAPRAALT